MKPKMPTKSDKRYVYPAITWNIHVIHQFIAHPVKFEYCLETQRIYTTILIIDGRSTFWEIALQQMSLILTDGESKVAKLMALCHQAANH